MTPSSQPSQPSATGRPRQFDDERVIDAALELFWQKGFRNTTTRDLESVSGLTSSSLYNAFGSKHEIFAQALMRYQRRITTTLVGPLEESTLGLEALDQFFASLESWIQREGRRGCLLVNMMAEDGGTTNELTKIARHYRVRMTQAFSATLHRAVSLGELPASDVTSRAALLVAQVLGINLAARAGAGSTELRDLIGSTRDQISRWQSYTAPAHCDREIPGKHENE